MTTAHESVDPAEGLQARPSDELEDWLTDLRVNLGEDPPDWLTAEDDIDNLVPEPSTASAPAEDRAGHEGGATDYSDNAGESLKGGPSTPAAGRHRAAE